MSPARGEAALQSFRHAFEVAFGASSVPTVASVSPCSWMYPHYGLQVEVEVAGGRAYYNSATRFDAATAADVAALAAQVRLAPCVCCGKPAIANAPRSNRGGQCEACFMAKLNAELAVALATEAAHEALADQEQAARGFRWKTVAWVHPSSGDDHAIVLYSASRPTAREIAVTLRKRGSQVTTDYRTTEISVAAAPMVHA